MCSTYNWNRGQISRSHLDLYLWEDYSLTWFWNRNMPDSTRSSGWWWRARPDSSGETLWIAPCRRLQDYPSFDMCTNKFSSFCFVFFFEFQKHEFQLTISQTKYHSGVHVPECVPMHNSNCNVQMSVRVTMRTPGNSSQDGSKHAERWERYTHWVQHAFLLTVSFFLMHVCMHKHILYFQDCMFSWSL